MASAADIVRHHEPDPEHNPWVHGPPPPAPVRVVPYDPRWPGLYAEFAGRIASALGGYVLDLEHVGSTAVPGLRAKPVIDIDLTVADPAREAGYVPALEPLGYVLRIREPAWHEHRCLVLDAAGARPAVNLHVFGPDCPETIRHRLFRDWLRAHPEDRARYAAAKQAARGGVDSVMAYNRRKEPVIREIYERAFRAAGLL